MSDICVLCNEGRARHTRNAFVLCDECVDQWDYQASLTPEERRLEDEAIARYTQESALWG